MGHAPTTAINPIAIVAQVASVRSRVKMLQVRSTAARHAAFIELPAREFEARMHEVAPLVEVRLLRPGDETTL